MKYIFTFLLLLLSIKSEAQNLPAYLSPKPGSQLVSRESNIIINCGSKVNPLSLSNQNLIVTGEKSGRIITKISLSDDGETIIAEPAKRFTEGEKVTVFYNGGFRNLDGSDIPAFDFSFTITPLKNRIVLTTEQRRKFAGEDLTPALPMQPGRSVPFSVTDSLPSDLPGIIVNTNNNPAPGYIFVAVSTELQGVGYYNFILDKNGKYVKYMRTDDHYPSNFQTQKNGLITYNQPHDTYQYAGGGNSTVHVLDTNLVSVDTFQCGNGYTSDSHTFLMLPNGHVIMVAYDLQSIDMSQIVSGGNPGALVLGSIVQELDLQRRVIFQWRSWDAIPLTDSYQNLKLAGFDYIHVNSTQMDFDGNIIISSRLTCDITKLNRKTGEIIWRMGGKKNQFTFINERPENAPTYFTHPHGFTILPNGNYLLLDNGLLHSPQYSRAVEYKIDEANKTATMVWEYRHTPDIYAATQGSVQRLDNGNTIIGWGSAGLTGLPAVTEVTSDKQVTFEMTLAQNIVSYRIQKNPFRDFKAAADVSKQDIQPGVQYSFNTAENITGVNVYFQQLTGGYNYMNVKRYNTSPINLAFPGPAPNIFPYRVVLKQIGFATYTAEVAFDSIFIPPTVNPEQITAWRRTTEGTGAFTPVNTSYNPVTKQLSVITSSFGEFIFGLSQAVEIPSAPIPFRPKVGELVNQTFPVSIGFSSLGITNGYQIIVAKDSLLTDIVVNDSSLTSGIFSLANPAPGARYYWKVRGKNDLGWSEWSAIKTFLMTEPYMTLTKPNGGEKWKKKSANFITWNNNIPGLVKIQLLKNDQLYSTIASQANNCGSYQWTIPDSLPVDNTYKVRVISVYDTNKSGISAGTFAIEAVSGAEDESTIPEELALDQNYPNPFNPATVINFHLPASGRVSLKLYDMLGEEVQTLISGEMAAGSHQVNFDGSALASGVYLYKLQFKGAVLARKLMLMK